MRALFLALLVGCGLADANDASPELPAVLVDASSREMPMPPLRLNDSGFLEDIPEIDDDAVILTPSSYVSWAAAFAANPNAPDYLLTGSATSYATWGEIAPTFSGTQERPRTIRYYGSEDWLHPAQRSTHALVDGGQFANVSYWHLYGLTFRAPTVTAVIWDTATHIVFDKVLIENSTRAHGIRIFGSYNTVQRSLLRDSLGGTDALAIQIKPRDSQPITGVKVLDCEVRDYGDAFGVTGDDALPETEVDFILDGFDGYITSARQLPGGLSDAENGIDIKTGNDRVQSLMRNVRLWGFRRNGSTAVGDGIVLHQYARNIRIENPIISDCPSGIREENWPAGSLERPRNFVFANPQFHDLTDFSGSDSGAAMQLVNNTEVYRGHVSRCDYVLTSSTDYRAGGPVFTSMVRTESGLLSPDATETNPYVESAETGNIHRTRTVLYGTYERRRWTGPEFVEGAMEVSTGTYAQIRDEQARLIEALTPTSASQVKFQKAEGRIDFREWASKNPTAAFRRFSIMGSMRDEGPLVTNTDVETYRTETIIVIAYPKNYGAYGAENERDLQDLVEEDRFLIDDTIGHRGQNNWLSCQNFCRRQADTPTDDGGSVWFVTLTFETEYQRAV